ncbi:MAG: hypothetical protein KGZ35_05900 [Truepera sp.]|nr:hypothetical protein [Truepera sp.]MBS3967448.1 hypothetical protein [Truepera sp.]
MQRAIHFTYLATEKLLQQAAQCEQALIMGRARPEEIDLFVAIQLELAQRQLIQTICDPRD